MNVYLHLPTTRIGNEVTVKDTSSGQSKTLNSDGRIEETIVDQVLSEGKHTADFQESIDTLSIKSFLKQVHSYKEKPEALTSEIYQKITHSTLGEGWTVRQNNASKSINASLRSGNQTLFIADYSNAKNPDNGYSIQLSTNEKDTEGANWSHRVSAFYEQDLTIKTDTIREYANVQIPPESEEQ